MTTYQSAFYILAVAAAVYLLLFCCIMCGVDNRNTTDAQHESKVSSKPAESRFLIAHYCVFYNDLSPNVETHSHMFLDCLGLYSTMTNLKPDRILYHTNVPAFWPFDKCESALNKSIDWSAIQVLEAKSHFTASGHRISYLQHEADLCKYEAVEKYGGLALDFDIYILDGQKVRSMLSSALCIVCQEQEAVELNAGFVGCHEPHAEFPRLILKSYETDYNASCWDCNSAIIPLDIHRSNPGTARVVEGICDYQHYYDVSADFEWADKAAHHSYFHTKSFNLHTAFQLNTTLGSLFRWLLLDNPPELKGTVIPMRSNPIVPQLFQLVSELAQLVRAFPSKSHRRSKQKTYFSPNMIPREPA